MNNIETSKRARSGWVATALASLVFASCGIAYAQKDKDKDKPAPPPARSAPAPAARPATPPPQATHHSAPPSQTSQPAAPPVSHQAPSSAQPNNARSAPSNPSGRGGASNATGGGAPNHYGRETIHNTPGQGNSPNPTGRGANSNPAGAPNSYGRGSSPGTTPNTPGRATAPNTGFNGGRGSTPGTGIRGNAPNTGPRPEYHGSNGTGVRFGTGGRPTVVHTSGATIVHAPSGARRIEVARPGGRVIVTNAAGHGYLQRPVTVRGQAFVQRTYYVHGAAYPRYYRASVYRGITFHVYTPVRYYSPRYYAWGYTPWGVPVYYNFGFAASPWYGYYGGYFTPYPAYAGPNYWLTDYLLANSLQEGYQEHMDAAAASQGGYDPSGQVALSPQVKNLIASEVQRQLAQESAESQTAAQNIMPASNGAPPILADNNPHVFVVSTSLIANTGSQECALTHGDVLQLSPAPSADPAFANVQVLASKGQDCQAGNLVPIQLADLQEMQNHMRETMDLGLGELQNRQGQGGLPTIEVSMRTQTAAPYAAELPPAESNAADELRQQAQEADRQERDVLGQAGQATAPRSSAAPVTLELGQTIADVVALMGQPVRIADLGPKKTYYYKDMKVIFLDGKVNDIQ